VIPRADVVYRIDAPACLYAGTKMKSRGVLLMLVGAALSFVGLLSTAYGVLAVVWFPSRRNDAAFVVAAAIGIAVFALPLVIGLLLLVFGGRRHHRGAELVDLASHAHGRTHVTVLDLAARTGRAPDAVVTILALAARHSAAAPL
jgi:hypothetical protein